MMAIQDQFQHEEGHSAARGWALDSAPIHSWKKLATVALVSMAITSSISHVLAHWLGITRSTGIYRRVGPVSGPQVFTAGSSLLVSGLDWPRISSVLGQGIENWSVGGSTPDIWEQFARRRHNGNLTVIGISLYDINETRVAADRAMCVPFGRSVSDLWTSAAEPDLWHRTLTQYSMKYLWLPFPTAGETEKVLVGMRRKAAELSGRQASLDAYEGVLLQPQGVLDGGKFTTNLTDWSSAKLQRRIEALGADIQDRHEFFRGPKRLALHRLIAASQKQGKVILVVFPVSKAYLTVWVNERVVRDFEKAVGEAKAAAPDTLVVRLDTIPDITDDANFWDLVHLNSTGRRLATNVFLQEAALGTLERAEERTSAFIFEPSKSK
jgi:hypothetical protein